MSLDRFMSLLAVFLAVVILSTSTFARNDERVAENVQNAIVQDIAADIRKLEQRFNLAADAYAIIVNPERQELYLVKNGTVQRVYKTSTARRGLGNILGSYKTPWGTHRINGKIGDGATIGTVFRGRENTGRIANVGTRRVNGCYDITSRIMRLDGQETRINRGGIVDSLERNIYIHGSANECIGTPSSGGCILLKDADVLELFSLVPEGTLVEIQKKEYRRK